MAEKRRLDRCHNTTIYNKSIRSRYFSRSRFYIPIVGHVLRVPRTLPPKRARIKISRGESAAMAMGTSGVAEEGVGADRIPRQPCTVFGRLRKIAPSGKHWFPLVLDREVRQMEKDRKPEEKSKNQKLTSTLHCT